MSDLNGQESVLDRLAPQQAETKYHFKHERINRFLVGKFEFKNHMLTIPESDLELFLKIVDGLEPIDRNNIKQVMEVENERSLDALRSRVVREAVGTRDIPDARIVQTGDGAKVQPSSPVFKPFTPSGQ